MNLSFSNVSKFYRFQGGYLNALAGIELTCVDGSFTALIGPSGCGKSTLLRLALGLEEPDSGMIRIGDLKPAAASRQGITGVAFQDSALLFWRSVEQNIALPLEILGRSRDKTYIRHLIRLVGLEGFEKALPSQLSGGMRQRAAIARALVSDPGILFLDEPFGALDQILRRQMNLELQRIWMESGSTTFLVTHGIDEAVFLADQIVIMKGKPGRILETIAVPFSRPRPAELFSAPAFHALVDRISLILHERSL
jgi:NitT/TauT family transport system ATP-binding protein